MGYTHYKELTVDSTLIGSDLTDLGAAFTLASDNDLRVTGSGGRVTSSSGYDIGFFSDTALTTQLPHELIAYTSTTGAFKAHVRLSPTAAADKVIYLGYANSDITTDQSDITTTGTFSAYADGGFGFVCHLNEDPDVSEPNQPDSSGQGNYFFPFLTADIGAPPPPFGPGTETCADQFASGVHDTAISWVLSGASGAYSLNGTKNQSTYALINSALTVDTQDFSISYWWKANATNPGLNSQYIFGMTNEGDVGTQAFQLRHDNGDTDDINIWCAEDDNTLHNYNTQITPSTSTVWHRFDGVYDDTANTYTMYVDGAQVNQLTSFAITLEDMCISVGRGNTQACPGQTYGDEARFVQGTAFSADWVAAEYESMIDSTIGNFWKTLGVETEASTATTTGGTMKVLKSYGNMTTAALTNAEEGDVLLNMPNLPGSALSVTVSSAVAGGTWGTVLIEVEYSLDNGTTWMTAADSVYASTTATEVVTEITSVKAVDARLIATTLTVGTSSPTLTLQVEVRVM